MNTFAYFTILLYPFISAIFPKLIWKFSNSPIMFRIRQTNYSLEDKFPIILSNFVSLSITNEILSNAILSLSLFILARISIPRCPRF